VDLYILLALTILLASWYILTGYGSPVALVLVILAPGYMVAATIYPRARDLTWASRILLSVVLSFAFVSLIAVVLDFSPWGARPEVVEGVLAAFALSMGYFAYIRRRRLALSDRISLSVEIFRPSWRGLHTADKVFAIALVLSVVFAFGLVTSLLSTPRPVERFTEFYILGPGQNASNYPTNLNVTQLASIFLGVTNHEYERTNYSIDIDLVGVMISYNATSGHNETVPVNLTNWSHFSIVLENGQTWREPYSFHIDLAGLWEIRFLLFRGENFSAVYRTLRLGIAVS